MVLNEASSRGLSLNTSRTSNYKTNDKSRNVKKLSKSYSSNAIANDFYKNRVKAIESAR